MKRKQVSLLLAAVCMAGMLTAGCGSVITSQAASTEATTAAAASDTRTPSDAVPSSPEKADSGKSSDSSGSSGASKSSDASESEDSDSQDEEESGSGAKESSALSLASGNVTAALLSADDYFSDWDLEQTADTRDAVKYSVSDGDSISITEEGVYILSGTASDVTIEVNAPDAKVQLVLDGLTITNEDKPAICVTDADKVFITTAQGSSNTLSVTGEFAVDEESNENAAIYSRSDLTLNGKGTLTIRSAQGNGIKSNDDVVITGGTYDITSAENGIRAHDSVSISDGTFTIDSGKDGIHSEDSDDETVGTVLITGGTFRIEADDDGIQGTTITQIDGGSLDITAAEGIEGTYVQINGGDITISASDDGINAAAKSSACGVVITFNGGSTTIAMGQGDTDAVDANGSIYVNDGTLDITAPTSSFDYDETGEINGGTVTVNGEQTTEMPAGMNGGRGGMGGGMPGGRNGAPGEGTQGAGPDGSGSVPEGGIPQGGKRGRPEGGARPGRPQDSAGTTAGEAGSAQGGQSSSAA